tara:strand:+ start:30 stop:1220 length:1191 start_codon:yes stop_codon:yes gene_type:complete
MGWLRKKGKQLRKGIKKIGKKIGKAFKSILKPFAKIFNKLGPLGTMAMMFILPGLGTAMAGWGATLAQGSTFLGQMAGTAIKFVGNAINFVATAPQKIFQSITSGISSAWNGLFKVGQAPTLGTVDALGAGPADSWWGSFKNDMQNVWGNRGVIDPTTGLIDKTASTTGGNFFDVSKIGEAANKTLKDQWSGPQGFKEDIKNLFSGDSRTPLTEANAKTTLNKTDFAKFMEDGSITTPQTFTTDGNFVPEITYKLDRTGVAGNIRDVVGGTGSKIGDITVPGVGDVSDVASVSSMAMGTYSTLSQYGVVGSDDEVRGSSGMGLRAEEQLYAGDQGGIYNISAPTWSYDSSASTLQNQNNAMSAWNNNYGFPQGFDPSATPGYGFSYQQWLQEQMAA